MMFCCLLCATTGMLDFLLSMTFSVFLFVTVHPSHGLPVLVLDIKVLVLALVLVLKLLSLGLGLGLG